MSRLRVATWNMHGGVGLDRRFSPQRIARVIAELDADVIALQEVGSRDAALDMRAHLESAGRAQATVMPTFRKYGCDFGNAVLTRMPVRSAVCHELGLAGREPRNAVELEFEAGGQVWRLLATHLGLRRSERAIQVGRICELLDERPEVPVILLGDFNEWRGGHVKREFDQRFGRMASPPTFPSPMPLIALDRIRVRPARALIDISVHRSRCARIASDHLPLVATLQF